MRVYGLSRYEGGFLTNKKIKVATVLLFIAALFVSGLVVEKSFAAPTVLIGDQKVESTNDSDSAGKAEAFKATATATGQLGSLSVYVNSTSAATKLVAGLYTNLNSHPGSLLGQGTLNSPAKGAWNTVNLTSQPQITSGTIYWIAILSPSGSGTLAFRDISGGGKSETSSSGSLSSMPGSWTTGTSYNDGPLSAYGSSVVTPDTTPPIAPSNLIASGITQTSATLSWTASTDNVGVTGYNVYLGSTKKNSQTSLSYTFTGLSCATNYTLGAEAYDAASNVSTRSTTNITTSACPDTTPPTTPSGLAQTGNAMTSITLGWTASTDNVGVTGYGIYNGSSLVGNTSNTSFTLNNLACGTPYSLGVDAYDAAGNHSPQAGYIASTSPCDTNPPSTPSNLVQSTSTVSSVGVSWSPSTDDVGVAGYRVYFDGTLQGTTTNTSFTVNNLTCATNHTFGVDAYDTAGNHSPQASLQVSTASCPPDTTPPSDPTGLNLTNITQTSATLSWTASTDNVGVTGYDVYANGTKLSTASQPTYSFTGLVCGTTYSLSVDAYDAAGNLSNQAYINLTTASCPDTQPPSVPANLAVSSSTGNSMTLQWDASADNVAVSGYRVYDSASNVIGNTSSTNFTANNLNCGTTYSFGVDAYDAAGNHSAQATVQASTTDCPPPDTTPPSVSFASPTDGSTISGTAVNLAASASDNVAVAGVQFKLDGLNLGTEDQQAPYSYSLNSTSYSNGSHTLSAVARDSSGNTSTATITVNISNTQAANPKPVPNATQNGVTVGGGFVEASARQIVRTSSGNVYVIVPDDNVCQNGGSGVIRAYKGSGAQPDNPSVPTSFAEVDAANHPVSAGSGVCQYSGGTTSMLFGPDIRLDHSGIIHIAYIDLNGSKLYYQTFSTVTDTWGTRTLIASDAQNISGSGWPRGGQVALALDANDVPFIAYVTSGSSNSVKSLNKLSGSWSTAVTIASGANEMHPSIATSVDGTIHLAWLDNSLASHSVVKYAHYSGGVWGTVETVSVGDSLVLANGDDDQGPSIATDSQNRPHVLFMDGTVNGSDNYVRMRYRTSAGVWTDNTPPGGSGGTSNPNGTWYAHTPQNYISSLDADFVFLGHDANISPGGYQYQSGGPGNNWSAYQTLDPRNQTNTTAGAPGLDGSASIRWDPLRDNNTNIIDLIYYDENDGTPGYPHHATVYYKAIQLN